MMMELAFKGLGRGLDTLQSVWAGHRQRKGFGVGVLEDVQESEAEHSGEVYQQKEQWVRSGGQKAPTQRGDVPGEVGRTACGVFRQTPCVLKVLGSHGRGLSRGGTRLHLGIRKFPLASPWLVKGHDWRPHTRALGPLRAPVSTFQKYTLRLPHSLPQVPDESVNNFVYSIILCY